MAENNETPTIFLQPTERFARLWTRVQPRVGAYVRSMVPDPHLADDILQDVAVTCMRKIEQYDPERSFKAWCVGVARIQVLRYRREAQRYCLLEYPEVLEAVAEVEEGMSDEMEARSKALRQCLENVSERTRQLLGLRYVEKHSHESIAGLLRLKAESVKVMLSRTRAALRECVEKRMGSSGGEMNRG